MPHYDYRCADCETVMEVEHSIHDDPVINCPECGCLMIRKPSVPQAEVWRGKFSERAVSKMSVEEGGLDDW